VLSERSTGTVNSRTQRSTTLDRSKRALLSGPATRPAILIISRIEEEAALISQTALAQKWAVLRQPPRPEEYSVLGFYGDAKSGPELVNRRLFEIIEVEFDHLARLEWTWTKRTIDFGRLAELLHRHRSGFFKPADETLKQFHATVYGTADIAELETECLAAVPALHSEPVCWGPELRAVVHRRRVLSLRCYAVGGQRRTNPNMPIPVSPNVEREAQAFCERLLDCVEELPPAFVMDVGHIKGRGWGVVEFNPLWCSCLFGLVTPAYLDALTEIIYPYGHVPAELQRWVFRSRLRI
jgi:hypothetical protein